jgi:formylmethanofuran dehydrogenase subunit B
MSSATLDGVAVTLDEAYGHAARILAQAKFPVVAGLGADVAGARAAILLAERLRGAFDHLASDEILADLDTMRSFAMFATTPNEARLRADVLLLVGPGLTERWPGLFERLAPQKPVHFGGAARKIIWLGPKAGEDKLAGVEVETLPVPAIVLPSLLAVLRARVGGRPVKLDAAVLQKIDACAETLKGAKFGVAVWSAGTLGSLGVEALQSLVSDLNATTRFSGVPLGARAGAAGVNQIAGWMTGFPPRTGFGRGHPEHDPWRFDARRLVDSGEADAALWISAYENEAPNWTRTDVPLVTLAPKGAEVARGVYIEVGQPGETHDAIEFAQEATTFVSRAAKSPGEAPSVADALKAIGAKITEAA